MQFEYALSNKLMVFLQSLHSSLQISNVTRVWNLVDIILNKYGFLHDKVCLKGQLLVFVDFMCWYGKPYLTDIFLVLP